MRIVTSENILNDRGEPATIGILGSCRVHGPIQRLIANGDAHLAACPFNAYTLTPGEALQYLQYCLGQRLIPGPLCPMVVGREGFPSTTRPFAELVSNLDLIIVEVSGLSRLEGCGLDLQANYFSTNFIRTGGRPYLDWWRAVSTSHPQRAEVGQRLVHTLKADEDDGCPLWKQELIHTARMTELDADDMASALDRLIELHPARFLLVTHFNLPGSDAIETRSKIASHLTAYGSQSGFRVFDPSSHLQKFGREKALKGGGRDIYHYSEEFERHLGHEILAVAGGVLSEPRPRQPGSVEAALPDDHRWRELRPFLRQNLDADSARALLPEITDKEIQGFAARMVLETSPQDTAALVTAAEHALWRDNPQSAAFYANAALILDPKHDQAAHIRIVTNIELGTGQLEADLEECSRRQDVTALADVAQAIRGMPQPGLPLVAKLDCILETYRQKFHDLKATGNLGAAYLAAGDMALLDPGAAAQWRTEGRAIHVELMDSLRDENVGSDPTAAIRAAEELIQGGLSLPAAFETLGRLHFSSGAIDKSIAAFRRCAELQPDIARHQLNLGRALLRAGQHIEAGSAFKLARDVASECDDSQTLEDAKKSLRGIATSLVQIAREMERSNKSVAGLKEAHDCFVLAATEVTEDGKLENWTHNLKRTALIEVLRLSKEAHENFEESANIYLQMCPEDFRVREMLAQQLLVQRRHEEAIVLIEALVRERPHEWINHLRAARCYDWLRMPQPMKLAAARTLELVPDNTEARSLFEREDQLEPEDLHGS